MKSDRPFALLLALAIVNVSTASAQEELPAPLADARFGIVNSGPQDQQSVQAMLSSLGASFWFSFGGPLGTSGTQVGLVRPGENLVEAARQAAAAPGATWLIGNEPNVTGQDDIEPARFARFFAEAVGAIRAADPIASFVGPNILNWDTTCGGGCEGFRSGREWSEEFLTIYRAEFGEPPLTAWGLHLYNLNWGSLPLIDAQTDQEELTRAREWLVGQGLDLPIWLSEFGIVWAYPSFVGATQPDGRVLAEPRGEFQTDKVIDYLNTTFAWLTGPAACQGVTRWFLYATNPPPEPFATVVGGIALLDPMTGALTPFGEIFRDWSYAGVGAPSCEAAAG